MDEEESAVESGEVKIRKMPRRGCTQRATTSGKAPSQEKIKDTPADEEVDARKMSDSHSSPVEESTSLRRSTRNRTPAKLVQVVVSDPTPRKKSAKTSPRTRQQQVARKNKESDQQWLSEEQSHIDLPFVSQQVILQDKGSDQQELSEKRSQLDLQQVVQQEPETDKQLPEERSQVNLRRSRRQIALQAHEAVQQQSSEECSRPNLRRSRRQVTLKEHGSDEQQLSKEQSQLDLPQTCRQIPQQGHGSDEEQLCEEQSKLDLSRTRRQIARQNHGSNQQQFSEEQSQLDLPRTRRQIAQQNHGSDEQQLPEEQSQLDLPRTRRQIHRLDHQQLSEEQSQLDLPRTRRQVVQQGHGLDQQQLPEEQSQFDLPRTRRQIARQVHGLDHQQLSEEQSQLDLPRTRRQISRTSHESDQQQLSEEQSQLDLPRTRRQIARTSHESDQQQLSEEQSQLDLPRTRRQVHGLDQQQLSEEQSQLDLPRTRRQIARQSHRSDQQQLSEEQSEVDLPRTHKQIAVEGHGSGQEQLSEKQSEVDLPRTHKQIAVEGHGSGQEQLSEKQSEVDLPQTRQQIALQDHELDQNSLSEEESQLDRPHTCQQAVLKEKGQGSDQKQLSEEWSQMDRPRTRQQIVQKKQGADQQQLSDERSQLDLPLAHQHNVLRKQRSDQQQLSEEQSKLDLPHIQQKVILQKQQSNKQQVIEQEQGSDQKQVIQREQRSDQLQVIQQEQRSDQKQVIQPEQRSDQQQVIQPEQRSDQQQVIQQEQKSDQQQVIQLEQRSDQQQVIQQEQRSDPQGLPEDWSQFDRPCMPQQIILQEQGLNQQQLPKEWSQLDHQKADLHVHGSDRQQLSEERTQEQSLTEKNHGKEMGAGLESGEQITKWRHQEEFKDMQDIHPAGQNATMDTDQFPDQAASSSILAQQGLNASDGDAQLMKQSARDDQSSSEEHTPLAKESCDAAGKPIGNQLLVGIKYQHENDAKEIKNADNSQRLRPETSAIDNQIAMLPTAPVISKPRYNMGNTETPDRQFLNPDAFVQQTPGDFSFKFPYPCQMKTACTDNKEAPCRSTPPRMKPCKTKHSQGHLLMEPSHLKGHSLTEPSHLQGHSVKEPSHLQGHSLTEPSHLQGHSVKEPSHPQGHSLTEPSHLQGHSVKEPSHPQGHSVKEPSHLRRHSLTEPSHLRGHSLMEPSHLQGHLLMEPSHLQGHAVKKPSRLQEHSVKEPSHLQRHLVKEPSHLQGHSVKEPSHLQGHSVKEPSHLQGHSLMEPSHLQEHSVKEPSHLQAHSLMEPSHLHGHPLTEPSHLQGHLVKEPLHLQEHSVKEPSHLQGHSVKEPSHLQGRSVKEPSHLHGHPLTEPSHLQRLSRLHENHIDYRSQSVFTDHSRQKEFGKDDSAIPPGTVFGESSYGMRQIFSGSEQKHSEGLDLSYPDAHLIYAGHNRAIEKAAHIDDKPSSNNATLGPTNMKQARKSDKSAASGRSLNKTDGIAPEMNLLDHNVFDYKTKPQFFDQSSVLNKSNSSPYPTSWPPAGEKTMPTSTSHPLLPQNMSLSSPVPIVCSYSGEMSSSGCGAKKRDENSYPNDAHSAPPPLETCSNQSKSIRSPSVPISTRPETKSKFCCDECTRSGGVSEKCRNMNSKFYFDRSLDNNARSNVGQVAHPDPQKPIQSAFTSAQNIPYDDNHSFKKSFCSQDRLASTCCASSTLVSTSYKPSVSVIKNDPSSQSFFSRNIAKTTCSSSSSPCLPPQHAHFMHPKDARYMHKAPIFYQAPSVLNASNRASHNNNLTYANSIHTSYSNNNLTIQKPLISLGNNKTDKTVRCAPSEEATNFQPPGYPPVSTSHESHQLTHICSAPNMVTPSYTSSIYTSSSNTATYISSTQSSQSQIRTDSTSGRYVKPPNFPAPPSYAEVIRQKNSIPKNHDLLASQNVSSCKKLLWQPFSEEKPMIHIKNEVITGTYPGEVPTSSQTPSSSSIPFDLSVFDEPHSNRQPSASTGHPLQQAVHQKYNTPHPMHPPDTHNPTTTKMKVDAKPRLGENGTSVPSGYKQRKVPQREMPPPLHSDSKQVPTWIPKVEQNSADMKNEIKCTFKIKNTEFSDAHFQNAFLNSFPKNTNIPLDKINRISNALNETTKRIFNNNHPESSPAPPHGADGRKTPDRKPTVIKSEPQLGPYANGSKTEPEPEPDPGSDPDDLFTRLKANKKMEIPLCGCLGPEYVPNETVEGPYYTHLGTGSCKAEIQKMMEERTGLTGKAVRVESIIYSGKEGKSTQGCPIAKWIVRRPGVEEKILCLVRQRQGHFCPTACIVICIVAWEGVPKSVADDMYSYLVPTLTQYGLETDRRCGYNEQKTCACQGVDMKKRGASFSFGCSWSMYFNGCKFARSREAKRFRLKDQSLDEGAEGKFQNLATRLAPLYKSIAPESYQNQVFFEDKGYECRLGHRIENDEKPCRPFSGVTACVDFCAHAHKDLHNMNNGCTVVVTLTKHGPLERPTEEQLHVLPLYILDVTQEALEEKIKSGGVEILANYPKVARIRATPFIPKRKLKKSKKDGVKINNKKENKLKSKVASQVVKNSAPVLADKFLKAAKNISGFNSKNNNLANKVNLFQNASEKNPQLASSKEEVVTTASSGDNTLANKLPESEKQPPLPAKANMYNEFWKYFYSYGTFPPANFLNDVNSADTMRFFATHLSDGKPIFPPPLDKSAAAQLLQHPAEDLRKDMPANVITRPGSACSIPLGNPALKDLKSPFSVSSLTADDFESPLHLLSEAVMIRSQTSLEKPRPAASHPQAGTSMSTPRKPGPNSELSSSMKVAAGKGGVGLVAGNSLHPQLANQALPNANVPVELSQDQHSRFSSIGPQFVQKTIFDTTKSCQPQLSNKESSSQAPFTGENVSRADCPDGCMRDIGPEVIRAELEYNEQNFYDPDIGGVAIALTHGSVLFEVAKRELHATTALLNPNRFSPTRISLVFYQHKSMNLRHHGWYENERKLELQRQKRLQKLQEEAEKNQPIDSSELKPGNKKRRKKDEPPPPVVKFSAQYTPMWPTAIKHTITQTTNSIITQWIDPQPTVSGPYQKWI